MFENNLNIIIIILSFLLNLSDCDVAVRIVKQNSEITLPCNLRKNDRKVVTVTVKGKTYHDNSYCNVDDCYIVVNKVTKDDVGLYECKPVDDGDSFKTTYNLLIGEFICSSDIGTTLLFGKSDCNNLPQSHISRKCSFFYTGTNISMFWRLIDKNNNEVFVTYGSSNPLEKTLFHQQNGLEYEQILEDVVTIDHQLDGLRFECGYKDVDGFKSGCQLPEISVESISHKKDRLATQVLNELKPVNCTPIKSTKTRCSYEWRHMPESQVQLTINGSYLEKKHMESAGVYKCLARCNVNGKICEVLADEFEIVKVNQSLLPLYIVIGVIVTFIPIILILAVFMVKRRRAQQTTTKASEKAKSDSELKNLTKETNKHNNTPTPATIASNNSNTTAATTSNAIGTPLPRSQPPLQPSAGANTGRRSPLKKSNSSITPITEEDVGKGITQIGTKILLNDVAPNTLITGVCHLGSRIYCVCQKLDRIFTFVDESPYNRIIGEEIKVHEMTMASDLASCLLSNSMYICDYNHKKPAIYRIFPNHPTDENRICSGKVDGSPASCSVDPTDPNKIVVIVKQTNKLHLEIYDTSSTYQTADHKTIQENATWEKRHIITLSPDVVLPLKTCISLVGDDIGVKIVEGKIKHGASGGGGEEWLGNRKKILYLLYGSGSFKNEFSSYKISRYIMETGRQLDEPFDLCELNSLGSSKFTSNIIVAVNDRGMENGRSILIVQDSSKSSIVEMDRELKMPAVKLKFDHRVCKCCTHDKLHAVVVGVPGSSSHRNPHLVVHRIG